MNYKVGLVLACFGLYACEMKPDTEKTMPLPQEIPAKEGTKEDTAFAVGKLEAVLMESGLVNIQTVDSTLLIDLKYSTIDNFVGVDVYGALKNCYLQPEVAQMLAQAHAYLKADHPDYRFLVYDGVRPLRVQQILWDTLDVPLKDKPKYVSDPKVGSIHNYGAAIDLTLADATGIPLDMGTGYDHFGYLAYPVQEDTLLALGQLSATQVQNRRILRGVMEKAGFSPITSEWWHFNAFSRMEADRRYEMIR